MLMRYPDNQRDSHHGLIRAFVLALTCGALAACATVQESGPVVSGEMLPEQRARFDARPDAIFAALEQACTAPSQRLTQPARDVLECRMLLPPDPTASAILRYGGTIDQLPELVIRLRLHPNDPGFVLAVAQYLEVPQQGGGAVQVVFPDARADRRLRAIITDLGGTPDPI